MQPLDLDAQLVAQFRIEVGERLVEQEHGGIPHQRAADGDTLALAAGKLVRAPVEERHDLQKLGRPGHALLDLGLRRLRHLQAEGHVLAHAHAGIERIGLEHHGDAAILGLLPGDVLSVDPDLPLGDVEQAGDGIEQGRLAAAGRSEQDDELTFARCRGKGRRKPERPRMRHVHHERKQSTCLIPSQRRRRCRGRTSGRRRNRRRAERARRAWWPPCRHCRRARPASS